MSGTIEPDDAGSQNHDTSARSVSLLAKVAAIFGIVAGFVVLWIVPGFFAVRSYRRWRAGKTLRPTFAWICAAAGLPFLALAIWLFVPGLRPLIDDDFSGASTDWPAASHRSPNGTSEEWDE